MSKDNALTMAREDLWFLNMFNDLPDIYRWRTLATADYISDQLGDQRAFEETLDCWMTKADFPGSCRMALAHVRDTGPKEA